MTETKTRAAHLLPLTHTARGSVVKRRFSPGDKSFRINLLKLAAFSLVLCALGSQSERAFSLPIPAADAGSPQANVARDGQHNFDFGIGVWHTHIRRILDPLSGSSDFVELNGIVTSRKIWGGRALLEEIEADGPKGHWEGLSLFLYNPGSHQWSQSFINSRMASLGSPLIGSFKDGRGELFSQDTFHDKSILVRAVWSNITPDSHTYEESYSNDGGKTWAPSFTANKTREQQEPASDIAAGSETTSTAPDGHEFDFDFGTWKTHTSRLLHPLTGSTTWVDLDGTTVVKRIWNGRANIAEFKATGSSGTIELMALRWYNPNTREWNINFATPNVGMLGNIPGVGVFKNGRCDFYDYEPINGKSVLVRFSIWAITTDTAQSEQAFSEDGGKTWEVNWINRYTRVKGD
jgi:hypothetical protein